MSQLFSESITEISKKPKEKLKRPSMYVVVLHDDPITPRGFVVVVLRKFFFKSQEEATRIMYTAHTYGVGAVATYTFEIAETKAAAANQYSQEQGYPLTFSLQDE